MDEASIFLQALQKPVPAERAAFLDQACAGDDALRRSVELLLKAHVQAGDFLAQAPVGPTVDVPARETAGSVIERDQTGKKSRMSLECPLFLARMVSGVPSKSRMSLECPLFPAP